MLDRRQRQRRTAGLSRTAQPPTRGLVAPEGTEGAEGQVLPAGEDLAEPARRNAHPGREVRPGDAALAHVEGDSVGQLRDQTVHLLVNLGLHGPLVWRNA